MTQPTDLELGVGLDAEAANQRLLELDIKLKALSKFVAKPLKLDFNVADANKRLRALQTQLTKLKTTKGSVQITTTSANEKLKALLENLRTIHRITTTPVTLGFNVTRASRAVKQALDDLDATLVQEHANIQVPVEPKYAPAKWKAFRERVEKGGKAHIPVEPFLTEGSRKRVRSQIKYDIQAAFERAKTGLQLPALKVELGGQMDVLEKLMKDLQETHKLRIKIQVDRISLRQVLAAAGAGEGDLEVLGKKKQLDVASLEQVRVTAMQARKAQVAGGPLLDKLGRVMVQQQTESISEIGTMKGGPERLYTILETIQNIRSAGVQMAQDVSDAIDDLERKANVALRENALPLDRASFVQKQAQEREAARLARGGKTKDERPLFVKDLDKLADYATKLNTELGGADQRLAEIADHATRAKEAAEQSGARTIRVFSESEAGKSAFAFLRPALSGFGEMKPLVDHISDQLDTMSDKALADAFGNALPFIERVANEVERVNNIMSDIPEFDQEAFDGYRKLVVGAARRAEDQKRQAAEFAGGPAFVPTTDQEAQAKARSERHYGREAARRASEYKDTIFQVGGSLKDVTHLFDVLDKSLETVGSQLSKWRKNVEGTAFTVRDEAVAPANALVFAERFVDETRSLELSAKHMDLGLKLMAAGLDDASGVAVKLAAVLRGEVGEIGEVLDLDLRGQIQAARALPQDLRIDESLRIVGEQAERNLDPEGTGAGLKGRVGIALQNLTNDFTLANIPLAGLVEQLGALGTAAAPQIALLTAAMGGLVSGVVLVKQGFDVLFEGLKNRSEPARRTVAQLSDHIDRLKVDLLTAFFAGDAKQMLFVNLRLIAVVDKLRQVVKNNAQAFAGLGNIIGGLLQIAGHLTAEFLETTAVMVQFYDYAVALTQGLMLYWDTIYEGVKAFYTLDTQLESLSDGLNLLLNPVDRITRAWERMAQTIGNSQITDHVNDNRNAILGFAGATREATDALAGDGPMARVKYTDGMAEYLNKQTKRSADYHKTVVDAEAQARDMEAFEPLTDQIIRERDELAKLRAEYDLHMKQRNSLRKLDVEQEKERAHEQNWGLIPTEGRHLTDISDVERSFSEERQELTKNLRAQEIKLQELEGRSSALERRRSRIREEERALALDNKTLAAREAAKNEEDADSAKGSVSSLRLQQQQLMREIEQLQVLRAVEQEASNRVAEREVNNQIITKQNELDALNIELGAMSGRASKLKKAQEEQRALQVARAREDVIRENQDLLRAFDDQFATLKVLEGVQDRIEAAEIKRARLDQDIEGARKAQQPKAQAGFEFEKRQLEAELDGLNQIKSLVQARLDIVKTITDPQKGSAWLSREIRGQVEANADEGGLVRGMAERRAHMELLGQEIMDLTKAEGNIITLMVQEQQFQGLSEAELAERSPMLKALVDARTARQKEIGEGSVYLEEADKLLKILKDLNAKSRAIETEILRDKRAVEDYTPPALASAGGYLSRRRGLSRSIDSAKAELSRLEGLRLEIEKSDLPSAQKAQRLFALEERRGNIRMNLTVDQESLEKRFSNVWNDLFNRWDYALLGLSSALIEAGSGSAQAVLDAWAQRDPGRLLVEAFEDSISDVGDSLGQQAGTTFGEFAGEGMGAYFGPIGGLLGRAVGSWIERIWTTEEEDRQREEDRRKDRERRRAEEKNRWDEMLRRLRAALELLDGIHDNTTRALKDPETLKPVEANLFVSKNAAQRAVNRVSVNNIIERPVHER